MPRVGADEVDSGLEGRSGAEDSGDACVPHARLILGRDRATEHEQNVFGVLGEKQGVDTGNDDVVGSGEDGQADAVDVLLDGGGDDHLGRLAQAGVDDFHAGIAEGAGDDLCTAVMAV